VLPIYQALPAPPITAAWLRARLDPVVEACRFERPIPLELRATGKFRGWCGGKNYYRDSRICLTSQAIFWRPDQILKVYLHECAHRLLEGCEVPDHGPEFFALTAAFSMRSAHLFERDAVSFLELYDFQDVPETNKGATLDWALKTAQQLAITDKTAEELAEEVCLLWPRHVAEEKAKKSQAAREKAAHTNLKLEVKNINTKLFLWRSLSAISCTTMAAVTYLSIIR
jgi:hypothetical protein